MWGCQYCKIGVGVGVSVLRDGVGVGVSVLHYEGGGVSIL